MYNIWIILREIYPYPLCEERIQTTSIMLYMVWLLCLALNLSNTCVPFLPSVNIERGFRRKSGAGDAGGGFFHVKSLGMSRMESLRSRDFLL